MMKRNEESLGGVSSRHSRSAFTLTELLVVIGVMGMLASLQLAALTCNRTQGQVMTCRYNLGQLTRAWLMYAEDNAGWFPPNEDNGFTRGWVRGTLSMNANNSDNTNQINLTDARYAVMAPYAGRSASLYRCPADSSVAREGANLIPRVRSIAMNVAIGSKTYTKEPTDGLWLDGTHMHTYGKAWRTYGTVSSLVSPRPENLFLLIDEDEYSINEGVFAMSMLTCPQEIIDWPAMWHEMAAGISFADGHVETHRWLDPRMKVVNGNVSRKVLTPLSADMIWLQSKTSALIR